MVHHDTAADAAACSKIKDVLMVVEYLDLKLIIKIQMNLHIQQTCSKPLPIQYAAVSVCVEMKK